MISIWTRWRISTDSGTGSSHLIRRLPQGFQIAGTNKHTTAQNIAKEYQSDIANRGLEVEQSYKNNTKVSSNLKGSTRLDVYDTNTEEVYDYKFIVNPGQGLSDRQVNKMINQGPAELLRDNIYEINPMP
jgi:hypothetical protein